MNDTQFAWAEKEKLRIARIEEDLENLEPLDYVNTVNVVAEIKKHWWKEEKKITLNSVVSIKAIIHSLKRELYKRKTFYEVVKDDDFLKFRCSHNPGMSDCDRLSCNTCNCSFDFLDEDINHILNERAPYALRKEEKQ